MSHKVAQSMDNLTISCVLAKERLGHFKATQALMDVRQAYERGLSESTLIFSAVFNACAVGPLM